MATFRLAEHVPDAYTRPSRDFQLMCNVFDCMNNGIKYDIDSMLDILDTTQCNERLLPLLQTKLGFFTKATLTTDELRNALQGFMHMVKHKGSLLGIEEAIQIFLKSQHISTITKIKSFKNDDFPSNEVYIIEISLKETIVNTSLLTEMLRYVLPAGYKLKYSFYTELPGRASLIGSSDTIDIVFVNHSENSTIVDEPNNNDTLLNGISTTSTYNLEVAKSTSNQVGPMTLSSKISSEEESV